MTGKHWKIVSLVLSLLLCASWLRTRGVKAQVNPKLSLHLSLLQDSPGKPNTALYNTVPGTSVVGFSCTPAMQTVGTGGGSATSTTMIVNCYVLTQD